MTDDELRAVVHAVAEPIAGTLARMLAILERLTTQIEILKLEQIYRAPSPETPRARKPSRRKVQS